MANKEEKKELLKGFTDYIESQEDFCLDNKEVMEILPSILKLQNDKGSIYGRSYCKHGDMSIFFNLERKWDRIQHIMEVAMEEGVDKTLHSDKSATATETFLDTIIDLASYSLLWAAWIKENYPDEWQKFLKFNELN